MFAAAVCLSLGTATAQNMDTYGVNVTNGEYKDVTDGTAIPTEYSGEEFGKVVIDGSGTSNFDEFTGQGYPIGFDFDYNGKKMNQFMVGTDGYVLLGKDEVYASCTMNPFLIFDNEKDKDLVGIITISKVYGLPETKLSYKVEGTAPSRSLVVQFKDLGVEKRTTWEEEVADTVSMQFRFYEESGNLSITCSGFEPWSGADMSSMSLKIGILGDVGDRLMLTDFASGATSTSDRLISWRNDVYPAEGVTYTFVAPQPCVTPESQPTQLVLHSTSSAISGTFTPVSDADHYLVLATKQATLDEMPADGTRYAEGDKLGQATVAAYTAEPSFATSELFEGASEYNVFVISSNAQCSNSPVYNLQNPLKGTVKTMGEAPKSLTICNVDANEVSLSVEANEGSQVLVAVTDSVYSLSSGLIIDYNGELGIPQGTYKVGDEIEGGGRVVYIGQSGSFKADGLIPGKMHVFCAWSTDGNGNYSSDTTKVNVITAAYMPWDAKIENMALRREPMGWKYQGTFTKERDGYIQGSSEDADAEGTDIWIETPYIYLGEKANRVFATMTVEEQNSWDSFKFEDGEYLKVQVSTDGTEYKDIAVYDKDNDPGFVSSASLSKFVWTFSDYAGQKATLRFLLHSTRKANFFISSLTAMQKPECDYPIDLKATDVKDKQATITWASQGNESAWEVSTKLSTDEEWSEPVKVTERSYKMEDLGSYKTYEVRVRAVCSETSSSDWSDTYAFKSNLYVPFLITMADETVEPQGWTSHIGVLADPTVFEDGYDFYFSYYETGSLGFSNYDDVCDSWYVSPQLDLEAGKEYELTLDIRTNYWTSYGTPSTDNKLMLLAPKDGETFRTSDVVRTIEYDEYKEESTDYSFTAPVKGFGGKTKLGIYVKSTTGSPIGFDIVSIGLKEKDASGISNATAGNGTEGSKPVAIYNAAGQRTDRLQKGINIVRNADGTTRKVLVK